MSESIHGSINDKKFINEKVTICSSVSNIELLCSFDKIHRSYDKHFERLAKSNKSDLWLNVILWNMQVLNLDVKKRQTKIDYLREFLCNTKMDLVYLIDVGKFSEYIFIPNYIRYTDGRNVLFVSSEIDEPVTIKKEIMTMIMPNLKWAFTYMVPGCDDKTQIEEIKKLKDQKFYLFGDFNTNSNKIVLEWTNQFFGEDSGRVGCFNVIPKRVKKYSAPSDHYLVLFTIKANVNHSYPLRIKEISLDQSKKTIKDILEGKLVYFRPKVSIKQRKMNINDGEDVLYEMLWDFSENKVEKVFKKYNYLWTYCKKEPFLGTKISEKIVSTFAKHLREDKQKTYKSLIEILPKDDLLIDGKPKIKYSKSKAITNEYISLNAIPIAIDEFFEEKIKNNESFKFNLSEWIRSIEFHKEKFICNSFFLMKNPKLEDFCDVRMIVIIPSFLKIYETIIYNEVSSKISEILKHQGNYQYGGIGGGSTYSAIYNVRQNYKEIHGNGVLCMDLTKGFDTVNLDLLEKAVRSELNGKVRDLSLIWIYLVYNLDIRMNVTIVKRTRGIPMGLSLSPAMFVFYCHQPIKEETLTHAGQFTMYVDDMYIILRNSVQANTSYQWINSIIEKMRKWDLIVNEKKTKLLSNDINLCNVFRKKFPIVEEEKTLGRTLGINANGFIIPDDRFFSLKSNKFQAFPNFHTFGIKRVIFITALDARNRYRFLVWSINDKEIRRAIFTKSWYFYKGNNDLYSYVQLFFCMFNVFRYFVDAFEVRQLMNDYKSGLPPYGLEILLKEKLLTGIPEIDKAIGQCSMNWTLDDPDDLKLGKKVMDDLFKQTKKNLLDNYIEEREEQGYVLFPELHKATKSLWFKNFVIFQNIIFNHGFWNHNKHVFMIDVCLYLWKWLKEVFEHNIEDWINFARPRFEEFPKIIVPKDVNDKESWREWEINYSKALWPFVNLLLRLESMKNGVYKKYATHIYKIVSKCLILLETMINNKNLNDVSIIGMEYIYRAKIITNDYLLDSIHEITNKFTEIEVIDYDMADI